jgi:chromosome partitioning protein
MRFLDSLGIPIIAVLRDSQNFVHAAEQGLGLCDMQPSRVRDDVAEIRKIMTWLNAWPERRRDAATANSRSQKPQLGRRLLQRAHFGSA